MGDFKKFGEIALQEVGQRAVQSVVRNPQAALATGIATAKVVGGAIVAAAPAVATIAVAGVIGYGIGRVLGEIFGD